MEVYFVRHGQTNGNVARRHQHPDTPLNFVGEHQVSLIAKEIARLKPTHLISSTQLRAIESTRIITSEYAVIPDTNADFAELVRPDWLIGSRYLSFTTLRYLFEWFFRKELPGGESYADFLARVKRAREYLESFPSDARVVVVSHAVFTNIFIDHLCREEKMRFLSAPFSFIRMLMIRNAGITHLHFSPGQNICGWSRVK
ncbi:MAG: histidine phosphatase family protein [Candidatus Paceibacterota bacterium]